MKETFKIPVANLAGLEKQFAKLDKRAKKLGVPPVKFEKGEVFAEKVPVPPTGQTQVLLENFREVTVEYVNVTVEGETPKYAGWTFLATLEAKGGGVMLRTVPGEELGLHWRKADPGYCDHCKKDRRRNETFVVRHDDGTEKQVGRQCIKDFLGGADPKQLLAWYAMLDKAIGELEGLEDEGYAGGGGGGFCPDTNEFLALVAMVIGAQGWVSRGVAYEKNVTATADHAAGALAERLKGVAPANRTWADPEDRHYEKAAEALEWARKIPEDVPDNYLHNVRLVAVGDYVRYKDFGILASVIPAHERARGREVERAKWAEKNEEEVAKSAYQGEVGKRVVFKELTLTNKIACETDWGTSWLMLFKDGTGNVFKTFASNPALIKTRDKVKVTGYDCVPDIGDTYDIKATVKAHEDYNGLAQTALTRCRIDVKGEQN